MNRSFLRLLALLPVLAFTLGLSAAPPDRERARQHEDCDPARTVVPLRTQVNFEQKGALPVALGAEFAINDRRDGDGDAVDWVLVLTTLDREVVDTRRGTLHL